MPQTQFKLKQASAASGVPPKDLQNFVQAGVLKPKKRADRYWFDPSLLLQAKVAWYLRETMGVSTEFLTRILDTLAKGDSLSRKTDVLVTSCLKPGAALLEIRLPVARLNSEIEQQLPMARAIRDLPRGRKRAGWKREFVKSLEEAATELGALKRSEILRTVRDYRKTRRATPEISVVAETHKKVA